MNPRTLTRADLAIYARNTATAIAAGRVKGFTPEQNAAMSAALAAEADGLKDDDRQAVAALAAYRSLVTLAQQRGAKIVKILTAYKFAMRGVGADEGEYEVVGFDPPADPRSRVKPKRPSWLSATGFSNGVNKLKFKGNNVPGRVTYIVEANRGDGAGWFLIGSTRKQSFEHKPVVPGQRYEYRVRAEATRGQVSSWSNKGVVYPDKVTSEKVMRDE